MLVFSLENDLNILFNDLCNICNLNFYSREAVLPSHQISHSCQIPSVKTLLGLSFLMFGFYGFFLFGFWFSLFFVFFKLKASINLTLQSSPVHCSL